MAMLPEYYGTVNHGRRFDIASRVLQRFPALDDKALWDLASEFDLRSWQESPSETAERIATALHGVMDELPGCSPTELVARALPRARQPLIAPKNQQSDSSDSHAESSQAMLPEALETAAIYTGNILAGGVLGNFAYDLAKSVIANYRLRLSVEEQAKLREAIVESLRHVKKHPGIANCDIEVRADRIVAMYLDFRNRSTPSKNRTSE